MGKINKYCGCGQLKSKHTSASNGYCDGANNIKGAAGGGGLPIDRASIKYDGKITIDVKGNGGSPEYNFNKLGSILDKLKK